MGIYLHGSAVMGCFNGKKSDIDLLVVVKDPPTDEEKLRFMNMAVELNALAPSKGIEFSIVKKSVCSPFVYPTPFELHFSVAHLDWFRKKSARLCFKNARNGQGLGGPHHDYPKPWFVPLWK